MSGTTGSTGSSAALLTVGGATKEELAEARRRAQEWRELEGPLAEKLAGIINRVGPREIKAETCRGMIDSAFRRVNLALNCEDILTEEQTVLYGLAQEILEVVLGHPVDTNLALLTYSAITVACLVGEAQGRHRSRESQAVRKLLA